MFKDRLTKILEKSRNILISGCGGGYDIFTGIPLYYELKAKSTKNIYLSSFSFTDKLYEKKGEKITRFCIEIRYMNYIKDNTNPEYFPEYHISKYFYEHDKEDIPVYAFRLTGVKPLLESYNVLIEKFNIDTIILVDGGYDSLCFGDEEVLGTPSEDVTSIVAVSMTTVENKILMCSAFGTEFDVSEYGFMENLSKIKKQDGLLGIINLDKNMESVKKYIDMFEHSRPVNSIINSSIIESFSGNYGYHVPNYVKERLNTDRVYINPLMSMLWFLDLETVVKNILYAENIKDTIKLHDVSLILQQYRLDCNILTEVEYHECESLPNGGYYLKYNKQKPNKDIFT